MQNYQLVPITKLKPDPEQPRKYFDEDALDGMVTSIKNEGLINAIEVDKDYVIVTGERRWRASKKAGLKDVPVKVLEGLTPQARFIRQVQENIHQNTMSAWDTAEALEKVREEILRTAAGVKKNEHGGHRHGIEGVVELSDLFGIPRQTITEFLDLLKETGDMKKALQTPGFQRTKVSTINREAPKKYQEKLKKIVADQKSIPRDTVRHIAGALRRAERYGEEDKAEKLLSQNFEGMRTLEALSKINKIVPDEESRVKEPADALRMMSEKIIEFMELMDKYPLESFDNLHGPLLMNDLRRFGGFIAQYLGLRKEAPKTLTKGE